MGELSARERRVGIEMVEGRGEDAKSGKRVGVNVGSCRALLGVFESVVRGEGAESGWKEERGKQRSSRDGRLATTRIPPGQTSASTYTALPAHSARYSPPSPLSTTRIGQFLLILDPTRSLAHLVSLYCKRTVMSSLFGGGARSQVPAGQPDQARLAEAAMELEAVSDLFTRIVSSCHAKCISTRYAEPELNKGESVCVDRCVFPTFFLPPSHAHLVLPHSCVAKYFSVNEKVQERLQSAQAAGGRVGM